MPRFLHKPKALRYAFAIEATDQRITLGLVKKWFGHAKIETPEICATPVGRQERALARLMWKCVDVKAAAGYLDDPEIESPHLG